MGATIAGSWGRTSQAAHWAAGIPHAQVEILPRTGHVPMVERPEEVSRLLRAFLEGA